MKTSFDEGNQWCWKLYRWFVNKFESVLTAWYKRFKLHIHSHRNIRYIAYKFLIVYLLYMLRNINWPEKLSFRDITALSLSHLSIFFLAYSIMSCYIVNLLAVFEFFHLLINVVCEWRYVATGKWSHDPIKKKLVLNACYATLIAFYH